MILPNDVDSKNLRQIIKVLERKENFNVVNIIAYETTVNSCISLETLGRISGFT